MPPPPRHRNPDNNPTERIQRILLEFGDYVAYAEALEQAIADNMPELMPTLPSRPEIYAYVLEEKHQQDNYSRITRARQRMARMRSASEDTRLNSNAKQQLRAIAKHGLTEERKREILAMIDDEPGELKQELPQGSQGLKPPPDPAAQLKASAEADAKIGLPPGVEIEPDPETAGLDEDLKAGSLFK